MKNNILDRMQFIDQFGALRYADFILQPKNEGTPKWKKQPTNEGTPHCESPATPVGRRGPAGGVLGDKFVAATPPVPLEAESFPE